MSGVLGASIPIAVGAAYASKVRGVNEVTFNGFGEGTSNRGAFHEGLNLAAIWDLPIVFICENNLYAEFSHIRDQMRVENVADRAAAYGMPGYVVDGNDPEAVVSVLREAVELAVGGGGPTLIEAKTYRLKGHYDGDPEMYRSKDEVAEWAGRDPIRMYRPKLLEHHSVTVAFLDSLAEEVAAEVDDGISWALDQDLPSTNEISEDVYANGVMYA